MTAYNAINSLLYLAKASALQAAEDSGLNAALAAASVDLDEPLALCLEFDSPSPDPLPSLRFHALGEQLFQSRAGELCQFSFRVYTLIVPSAVVIDFKAKFRSLLGLKTQVQRPGFAIQPLYDFRDPVYLAAYEVDENSVPPVRGNIELTANQTWQDRSEGPNEWHHALKLTLTYKGD